MKKELGGIEYEHSAALYQGAEFPPAPEQGAQFPAVPEYDESCSRGVNPRCRGNMPGGSVQ